MSTQSATTIGPGKVVSIHYVLTDDDGVELDSSRGQQPLEYLHGAGNIVVGLESGLVGHKVGDRFKVDVAPEEGYGVHDPEGVQRVARDSFPTEVELEPGMQFMAEEGDGEAMTIWIQALEGDMVVIDMNHPLAGKTLHFDVEVSGMREATAEELEHGHPHGPHGHHHHN
jgi:FKBP-type peptidyl-prolyl cis-trans isomerase SlyD